MNGSSSKEIIEQLIANDEFPPDDHYSSFEFGRIVGSRLTHDEAATIIRECFERLPSSLAETFVSGLLELHVGGIDVNTFISAIENSRELGAGSSILTLLCNSFGMDCHDIAQLLISRIRISGISSKQDRLCYALWWLLCGETYDVASGSVKIGSDVRLSADIRGLLEGNDLSVYSRQTIIDAIKCVSDREEIQ